ncbi:MAG: arsenic resistance N-acetyltransferase ArsN2 [Candidatus Thorarchaeota archaeon]
MNVILKQATEEHLSRIVNLLKENNLPSEDIPSKMNYLFLGYAGSQFVGIGGLEIHENYGLLRSLTVEEPARGQGYGKAICMKLIDYAKEKRILKIYLLTETAQAFFAKLNFEKIDRNTAPPAIQKTAEFATLCPDSAVCMMLELD